MTLQTIGYIIGEFVPKDKFPEEFDTLLHEAQMTYFHQNMDNDGIVFPFIKHMGADTSTMPLVVNSIGIASLPVDFAAIRSMTVMHGGVQRLVEVVEAHEWRYRQHAVIETPDREHPIATFQGKLIRFAPKNIQAVNFTYLSIPPQPVYATTINTNRFEYDAANSVELLWLDQDQIEITRMVIANLGVAVTADQIREKLTQNQTNQ